MNDLGIGKIIDEGQKRDAIHIAIAPVVSSERLAPGQDIGFVGDGIENVGRSETPIGIVDPYLKGLVFPGQRFWMFLYPGTVTSLRHDWAHPAFGDASAVADSLSSPDKAASEMWLRSYAAKMNNYSSPEDAYAELLDGLRQGQIYSHGSSSVQSLDDLDDVDELKIHAENMLGIRIDWYKFTFSCSC